MSSCLHRAQSLPVCWSHHGFQECKILPFSSLCARSGGAVPAWYPGKPFPQPQFFKTIILIDNYCWGHNSVEPPSRVRDVQNKIEMVCCWVRSSMATTNEWINLPEPRCQFSRRQRKWRLPPCSLTLCFQTCDLPFLSFLVSFFMSFIHSSSFSKPFLFFLKDYLAH